MDTKPPPIRGKKLMKSKIGLELLNLIFYKLHKSTSKTLKKKYLPGSFCLCPAINEHDSLEQFDPKLGLVFGAQMSQKRKNISLPSINLCLFKQEHIWLPEMPKSYWGSKNVCNLKKCLQQNCFEVGTYVCSNGYWRNVYKLCIARNVDFFFKSRKVYVSKQIIAFK